MRTRAGFASFVALVTVAGTAVAQAPGEPVAPAAPPGAAPTGAAPPGAAPPGAPVAPAAPPPADPGAGASGQAGFSFGGGFQGGATADVPADEDEPGWRKQSLKISNSLSGSTGLFRVA